MSRQLLLAIDAILNGSMTDADARPVDVTADDDTEACESTRKLMKLAEQEGVVLVVYGHDSRQWATLKQAPAYYN